MACSVEEKVLRVGIAPLREALLKDTALAIDILASGSFRVAPICGQDLTEDELPTADAPCSSPATRVNSVQYPLPTRGEASKGIVAVAKGGAHSSASLASACSSSVKVPDVALLSARNAVTIAMGSKTRRTST